LPQPLRGLSDVSPAAGAETVWHTRRGVVWSTSKEDVMSVSGKTRASEKFAELSEGLKKAEQRVDAAKTQAKADVERSASEARASAQAHADKLRKSVDTRQDHVSASWNDMQKSWSKHMAKMHDDLHDTKSAFDATVAVNDAEDAEGDAYAAIDFAYGAVEEAEASVLDAISAWMEADELAQKA
jgi:hypothetical protein